MDEFDFKEEKTHKPSKFGAAIWNCASILFFFAALAAAAFFVLLFLNPQSEFNPFPPPDATAQPSATATLLVSETPTPTPTATLEPPTATSTPDEPGGFFGIQEGSPAALDSTVFHPELACNFMGVAGQAFGLDSAPIADLRVQITGTLNGEAVDKTGLTGAATQYGSGQYYEVQLAATPIASDNTLQIVLLDAVGQPISAAFTFSTTASCQENLLLINFSEQP